MQADSSCFEQSVDSTKGLFVPYDSGQGRPVEQFVLISEPTQQGCLWVQGGVRVALGEKNDEAPRTRRLVNDVWACNACDRPVEIALLANGESTIAPRREQVFIRTDWKPSEHVWAGEGPLLWPNAATYWVPRIRDSVFRVDFSDGSAFAVGCFVYARSGGTFRMALQPEESITFSWDGHRESTISPPRDLPDGWSAPPSGTLTMMPSVHLGSDPLKIPELRPRVCPEMGFEVFGWWSDERGLCYGHCLYFPYDNLHAEFQLEPEDCPYECPDTEPPIQVEVPIREPYPDGLFYGKAGYW